MSGNLCEHCVGYCCRHIALPIDAPEKRSDFDDIRWYLLHEGVGVFVEDGQWYLQVNTPCRHLQADYRCGVYETRPQICRDYTTENCDYHSGDYGYQHHFLAAEHLDAYVEERYGSKKNAASKDNKSADKSEKNTNSMNSSKSSKSPISLKVKLSRRPTPDARFIAGDKDRRGVQLPQLGGER